MVLGSNIKTFRKKRKLNQRQLAEMIGVSKACLCLYESGKRNPSVDVLIRIADTLQVSLDDLVERNFQKIEI